MKTMRFARFALACLLMLVAAAASFSADAGHRDPSAGLGKPLPPGWEPAVHDRMITAFTLLEKAEFRTGDAPDAFALDAEGWIGGDYQRFWWKADADQETRGAKPGEFEVQGLYSRLFAPFWDFQAGLRIDRQYRGRTRATTGYLAVGVEGLAPYWFEVEPTLFLSEKGKASFRFTGTYDQLITQRVILQPRIDLNAALQDDPRRSVAAGVNDIELGVRLRYDVRRQFSPYVGFTWRRVVGETAGLARRAGEQVSTTTFVFGVRSWF